jgi:hypothetical protein
MTVKMLKQYRRAREAQGGCDIVQVGRHYVVGAIDDLTSINIINKDGHQKGTVTVRHLKRLGNANWARPRPSSQDEFAEMVIKDFIGQNWAQFVEYCRSMGHNVDSIEKYLED